MTKRVFVLAASVLSMGCGPTPEPDAPPAAEALSPRETVQAMLSAARADDWETYVDEFYGEREKLRSPADREGLIARFRGEWGAQVIPGLEAAAQVEPTLSEDGSQAVFALESGDFILYKDATGKWGFHL